MAATKELFGDMEHTGEFLQLMGKAVALSEEDLDDLDAIHALGEGWVGDEALAIAVYCALKYPENIERALVAAVNHKGDSDSTGAIAGNSVGAHVGFSRIPEKFVEYLELKDLILEVADDMSIEYPTSDTGKKMSKKLARYLPKPLFGK